MKTRYFFSLGLALSLVAGCEQKDSDDESRFPNPGQKNSDDGGDKQPLPVAPTDDIEITTSLVDNDQIEITWKAIPNAKFYRVERSGSSDDLKKSFVDKDYAIYYDPRPCGWETPHVHFGDNGSWTKPPGIPMEKNQAGNNPELFYFSIEGAEQLTLTFNDGDGDWDSRNGQNYTLPSPGVYELTCKKPESLTKLNDSSNPGIRSTEIRDTNLPYETQFRYTITAIDELGQAISQPKTISLATEYRPHSIYPYLTWSQSDASKNPIVIHYETSVKMKGTVEVCESEAATVCQSFEGAVGNKHRIALSELVANQKYYYRIFREEGPSEFYWFKTLPENTDNITFALASDMQDGEDYNDPPRRWSEVAGAIRTLMTTQDIHFMLVPGDFLSNDRAINWKHFFDRGKDLLPYIVMMPAVGNHDTKGDATHNENTSNPHGTQNFLDYFSLPSDEEHYYFQVGSKHFFVLNSERDSNSPEVPTTQQYSWFKDKLETVQAEDPNKRDWYFTTQHIPLISAHNRHSHATKGIRPWSQLFDGAIDWNFAGHVHAYHRFQPLTLSSGLSEVQESYSPTLGGTGYIILPPAGHTPSRWRKSDDRPDYGSNAALLAFPDVEGNPLANRSQIGFATIELRGSDFSLKTYGMGTLKEGDHLEASLIDSLEYSK
ncbi:MAG: hypothetical protein HRU19_01000 [Pseudobacteriovorax sp.]|nr:hypothetical protein [Pseudobacteriovorax sp.]